MAETRDRISKDGDSQEPTPETCPLPFIYVLCDRWHPHFHTRMLRTHRHFFIEIDFARFDKVNAQFFSIIFEGQGDGESRSVAKTHQMVANGVTWTRSVPDLPAALV